MLHSPGFLELTVKRRYLFHEKGAPSGKEYHLRLWNMAEKNSKVSRVKLSLWRCLMVQNKHRIRVVWLLKKSLSFWKVCVCVCVFVCACSHVWLFVAPCTVTHQSPPSMGFPRQAYWSVLPFPSPGDLPDPGIQPVSPELPGGFFTTEPPGKPQKFIL